MKMKKRIHERSRDYACTEIEKGTSRGKKLAIVLTGGCFNRIHKGHISFLKECRKLGRLIVVLAHDSHNKKKNAVPAEVRKRNIESLQIADVVAIGDPEDYMKVVKKYKPDIVVLGHDQKLPPGKLPKKIKVVRLPEYED